MGKTLNSAFRLSFFDYNGILILLPNFKQFAIILWLMDIATNGRCLAPVKPSKLMTFKFIFCLSLKTFLIIRQQKKIIQPFAI